MEEGLVLSYGAATVAAQMPSVRPIPGRVLRLADGPYPFPEPPDLFRLARSEERLAFLCDHLQSLCGLWDKPARLFLAVYFAGITAAIAAAAREIDALAAATGGLFSPSDWSFAAPRPLPQAHLPADAAGTVRADFAFWTGTQFIAIELLGSATPRRQRRAELARLAAAGVAVIALPAASLPHDGPALLARHLPPLFRRFWEGVRWPGSPFAPAALAEIAPAGAADQKSGSIT